MKSLTGKVVSMAMKNTIVVEVVRTKIHPLYKKIMKRSRKYKAHIENEVVKVGDMVEIGACRPISKDKNYKLVKILK